jgi:hypothetical protein
MVLNHLHDTDGSDDMDLSWDMLEYNNDDDDGDERGGGEVLGEARLADVVPHGTDDDDDDDDDDAYDDDVPPAPFENDASVGVTISRTPTTNATPEDDCGDDNDDDESPPPDNDVSSIGVTISDGDTFISGVSSITGENRTVSDIDDGEEDDDDDDDVDDGVGDPPAAGTMTTTMDASTSTDDDDVALALRLAEMGFELERITRAVSYLRDRSGASNVDIDAIVGIMMDEAIAFDVADDDRRAASPSSCGANYVDRHHPLHPLVDAWEYVVGSTMYGQRNVQGDVGGAGEAYTRTTMAASPVDPPRRLRTAEGVRAIGRTARGAWCIVVDESHRIVRRLVSGDREGGGRRVYDADVDDDDDELDDIDVDRARTADRYSAATAQKTRPSAKDAFLRANEEHRILEKVVAVAVVGSAALLTLGNPRASLGAMAVAGATLAAGEVMRCPSGQSCGGGSRGHGLHLD